MYIPDRPKVIVGKDKKGRRYEIEPLSFEKMEVRDVKHRGRSTKRVLYTHKTYDSAVLRAKELFEEGHRVEMQFMDIEYVRALRTGDVLVKPLKNKEKKDEGDISTAEQSTA